MIKLVQIILSMSFTLIMISCSNSETAEPDFNLEISLSKETVEMHEGVRLEIRANQYFNKVVIIIDGKIWDTIERPDNGWRSTNTRFLLRKPGPATLSVQITNSSTGEVIEKTASILATATDPIKLNQIKLISFHNKDQAWDPHLSGIDQLADLSFGIVSPGRYFMDTLWNQGNLTWDLADDDIYYNSASRLEYAIADVDSGGLVDDIMLGPPFSRIMDLSPYLATKPNTITFSEPDIDLEFEVSLEWF